ncbi:hypothetical protein CKM354_000686400 [Cercospora kikuchii]|uniref:Uncharacterized protein n=1 Tax=Cercospora kikuchii TaxID=84275 RepID=A0A9P3CI65_9PEZI|nr:uncharacterized protein CKM354_000686400 [Cercospora kikuchii]GIZ43647.1 hypothetical protein CKM354_000686400 [Cercospora kikuchii]
MSALHDNSVGGIPNTEQRGAETTPQQIHQEGAQYVKEATQANQSGSAANEGTGTITSRPAPEPIREQPPASNPGSDDPTGGIGKDAGGVSGSAYIGSPVSSEEHGLVDTVKSFLGLSKPEEKKAEDTQPAWNAGSVTALAGVGASTSAPAVAIAAASGTGHKHESSSGSFTAEIPDRTRPSTLATTEPAGAVGSNSISTTDQSIPQRSIQGDSTTNATTPPPSSLNNPSNSEPDTTVTAGSHLTKTGPDFSANEGTKTVPSALGATTNSKSHTNKPEMKDTEVRQQQPADADEKDNHKPPKPADKSAGGKFENVDAIPTAGGQRLGEEHWGESKIVPDLPEKRASTSGQGGVSSTEGQPTSEVADNTAANTGGATGGPGSTNNASSDSGEKQGALDKIKDKLNIGKK